jgi:ERF superfamily protein
VTEKTALAKTERAELAKPPPDGPAALLQTILGAARDQSVSVEKLERLFELHQKMVKDAARTAYYAALSRVQAKLPRITKEGHAVVEKDGRVIRDTPFARYEDIDKQIRPILADEGFAVSFNTRPGGGLTLFVCELSHCEGHSEERSLPLPVDQSGGKNAIQAMGSSVSYAKRYLLGMHLNIITVGEDDDGNGGQTISKEQVDFLRKELASFTKPGEAAELAARREGAFLRYLKVETFEAIPASAFQTAVNWVDAKRGAK